MRMYDIIRKKRDGGILSDEEIAFVVKGYTDGIIPDYQMSAFAMALYFNSMTDRELFAFTDCIAKSGDTLDLSRFGNLTVDKHSTGGVGDKTTLIVAPLVASLGGKIAKMSGRGLGHTGGTIDKLESIEGFRAFFDTESFLNQVEKISVAVVSQTADLAPFDKKLYALRDVTATVDSFPLIASSVMSKKLAAGARSIVLDVKTGSGAFVKTLEEAEGLAEKMVDIGHAFGRKVCALITDMDTPLGNAVGNALEVKEAVSVLKGGGPEDLKTLCIALSSNMLSLCRGWSLEESEEKVIKALSDGSAFAKMKEWIAFQGGNADCLEDTRLLPQAPVCENVYAPQSGYIIRMDAEKIGLCAMLLGAGREKKDDTIDMSAGIVLNAKTGQRVKKGEVIAQLHTSNKEKIKEAAEKYLTALSFGEKEPQGRPVVFKIIKK